MSSIKIVVRYQVPSLNTLFAMNPWQRRRERMNCHRILLLELHESYTFQLRRTGRDQLTPTISQEAANIWWTAYDTLRSYMETARRTSRLKSANYV